MNYVDLKYINILSTRLSRFKKKSVGEYNFRCPFCGDSQKSESKARGWIIEKKGKSFFYCHNCNISQSLYNLIQKIDVTLAKEYSFEKFKDTNSHSESKKTRIIDEFKFESPKFKTNILSVCDKLSDLDDNHVAVKYVKSRSIPEKHWKTLYYIDQFNKLEKSSSVKDERLIIPYYNLSGDLTGFTGRALTNSNLRYINISKSEEQLFYGLNKVNLNKPIYIVEGAIDSMFIDNGIAVNNSNLSRISNVIDKNKCVLIPDREPRNKVIVSNIENFINSGFNVCLLPDTLIGKDINEYILNGVDINEFKGIVDSNIYSGIYGKLKLTEWKKI